MDDNTTTACSPLSTKDISLLTLQKSDLLSSNKKHEDESLVLMQLPCSLNVNDIQGARMIATHNQQASLVVERKGMSFDISRVETSNAYICVSPNQQQERPAAKRTKSNDSKTLVSVHARLLQPGGSGASFLELKPKCLSISHLQEKLSECVFDPYNNVDTLWTGKTLATLVESLQVSQKQVMTGLQRMQALCLHENGVALYGLLSQEALQEATSYIIATLTECEEFAHYTRGISKKECIHQVMTRVPTEERYPHLQDVIQHTLTTLESDDSNDSVDMESDGDAIRLNVTKVAKRVVQRLFCQQTEPWDEQELLSAWQREMPGVEYQVSIAMLSGVALLDSSSGKWSYFSETDLSTNLVTRFEMLFQKRPKWTLEELQPYVQRFTTEELSEADLLLQHTSIITQEVDGKPTKLYVSKY